MELNSVMFLTQKYSEGEHHTEYCKEIASKISEEGGETHLVCFGEGERDRKAGDINLHEFSFQLHGDNYFSWSMLIQTEFMRKIRQVLRKNKVQVVHANDWFTVPAALTAKKLFGLPFLITYHSVENERGMDKPHSHQISDLEWQGIEGASYVVVHDEKTADAMETFEMPRDKLKLLDGHGWKQELVDLYEQTGNVSKEMENLKSEGEGRNENFNAYMGVSSE